VGISVAVAGASGYAGGELLRLVSMHPDLSLSVATAAGNAGQPISSVHPQLPQFAGQLFEPTSTDVLGAADVVFLALPHGESAAVVAQLPSNQLIVDIGADFRLRDAAAWEKFYGSPHAGSWTYGLPELPGARPEIAASRRIANPGCFVTAATLALAPLFSAGLAETDDVVVVAASGTTGAGRSLKANLLASEVMGSVSAYKVGGAHQHTPEIEQNLSAVAASAVTVSFTPLLVPMPRGILATCTATLLPGVTAAAVAAAFTDAYSSEPFVHLLAEGLWPTTGATLGSNSTHIQWAIDERTGRVVVISALDNLTKGAAGQAVQNANIALGLDETAGLPVAGVAP
jgi:N-acetyl-gamma-glutamyl-phosphate reductase